MAEPLPAPDPDPAPSSRSSRPGPRRIHPRLAPAPTPRRRLLADRAARWVVSAGGIAIIASILGILLFILAEIRPIFSGAKVDVDHRARVAGGAVGAILGAAGGAVLGAAATDEGRTLVVAITSDGRALALRSSDGAVVAERPIAEPAVPVTAS